MDRIFTPVIHCESREQTLRNVELLSSLAIQHCFLIGHSLSYRRLISIYEDVKHEYPHFWLGINFLDLNAESSVEAAPDGVNAIWVDDLGIDEYAEVQELASKVHEKKHENVLLFGGIAFKYQREVRDLVKVAREAVKFCEVPTTSGDGTGVPASVNKIRMLKNAIGDKPLAIASGITPDNVYHYMDYISYYLVATGISDSFTELNPQKVKQLKENLLKEKYFVEAPLFATLSLGLNHNGDPSFDLLPSHNNIKAVEKLKEFLSFERPVENETKSGFYVWLNEAGLDKVMTSPLQSNVKKL